MRQERNPTEWREARSKIFSLFHQLGIHDVEDRHFLQQVIAGSPSLRFMTDEEHLFLIHFLTDLNSRSKEEQALTLEGLMMLRDMDEQDLS